MQRRGKRLKFGIQLKVYRAQWNEMYDQIQAMEAGRWNSIWFPDHFLPPTPISSISAEENEQNPAYDSNTLHELEIIEYRGAKMENRIGSGDLGDQRILY